MRSPLGNTIPSSRNVTICVMATTSSVPGGGSFTPEFKELEEKRSEVK